MSYRFADSLRAGCKQTCMTYTIVVCTVKKTPDDGQGNCPEHVEFYSKNKFEKLAHLVGFIIRITVRTYNLLKNKQTKQKLFIMSLVTQLCDTNSSNLQK